VSYPDQTDYSRGALLNTVRSMTADQALLWRWRLAMLDALDLLAGRDAGAGEVLDAIRKRIGEVPSE
jgi:hypothetical protein